MKKTITLTMSIERAQLLSRAMETIARVGMCQFADMVSLMRPDMNYDQTHEIERYLKDKIRPSLGPHSYNGIAMKTEVPIECQVAWEAYQYLRRELSWDRVGKDFRKDQRDWSIMCGVSFDDPMKVSGAEGKFKTSISKEE